MKPCLPAAVPPGADFRSFDEILAPDRRRAIDRRLAREAWAFLTRMTAAPPPHSLVRTYRNALRAEGLAPLGLPRGRLACGFALRWRERVRRDPELRDRHPAHRSLLSSRRRGAALKLRAAAGMTADLLLRFAGKPLR